MPNPIRRRMEFSPPTSERLSPKGQKPKLHPAAILAMASSTGASVAGGENSIQRRFAYRIAQSKSNTSTDHSLLRRPSGGRRMEFSPPTTEMSSPKCQKPKLHPAELGDGKFHLRLGSWRRKLHPAAILAMASSTGASVAGGENSIQRRFAYRIAQSKSNTFTDHSILRRPSGGRRMEFSPPTTERPSPKGQKPKLHPAAILAMASSTGASVAGGENSIQRPSW